ncbi:MAG: hypothetical protein JWN23_3347 [Rhodocyclales bacterium]|nr:hypothetical protein [Rhodocyclales bacterium]
MFRSITRIAISALLLLSQHAFAQDTGPNFPHTDLSVGMFRVDAEVASTEVLREYGLMFRKNMVSNAGMVFIFDAPQQYCMWMKNTLLPLSVAFIDDSGKITNIEDMQPLTENSHCANRPVRFALEMNKGWFKDKNFKAGTKIVGLERFGAKAQ